MDTQYLDLMVRGFARHHHQHSTPVVILDLIKSFYSLWIKHRLSRGQLEKLTVNETIVFPIHRIMISGTVIEVHMDVAWNCRELQSSLTVDFPSNMDFIAGTFAVGFDEDTANRYGWVRLPWTQSFIEKIHMSLEELKSLNDLFVVGYWDITQIQWDDEQIQDFDITPCTLTSGRHRWVIGDEELHNLRSGQKILKTPDQRWEFSVDTFEDDVSFDVDGLVLQANHSFVPLSVSRMECQWNVRYQIDGKKHCVTVNRQTRKFTIHLKVEDLENKSRIEFDIAYEFTNLYDFEGIEINKGEWIKHKVI